MKTVFCLICALALLGGVLPRAWGGEPPGEWKKPSSDGKPWKHTGTGLSFPQRLGEYHLMGIFTYAAGGVFVRYEYLDMRARADIFLFPATEPTADLEDRHRLILKEMDTVVTNLQGMANEGRYKNIQPGELAGGQIPLWHQPPLPMATRVVTSTRIGMSDQGVQEAVVKQWIGVTVVKGFVLTIRHMRPADTGAPGEDDMKSFAGAVFQVIKDPPLRAEIGKLIAAYLQSPFSETSDQAAVAVLAYLQHTPFFSVHIPEHPFNIWLERCKAVAPGTEDELLRAFMLGSAKAALDDSDAKACLNAGSHQFARVYRVLVQKHPNIGLPEIEQFVEQAEKDKGADWLKEHGGG